MFPQEIYQLKLREGSRGIRESLSKLGFGFSQRNVLSFLFPDLAIKFRDSYLESILFVGPQGFGEDGSRELTKVSVFLLRGARIPSCMAQLV